MSSPRQLPLKEKIGYGLGDTASNIFFQFVNIFLLYYYTDVFGLTPADAGTLFVVTRLWDAINDPLMGALSDRTRTRFGTYRPYLLWMAIPFGIAGYLVFANPDFGYTGKLIYAYATYIALMTAYTAINVPYSALMGVITSSPEQRTILSTFRFIGAFSGQLVISLSVRPLVKQLGGGDEALGFQLTMGILALLAVILFFLTFAAILTLSNVGLRGAVTAHYFKYFAGDDGSSYFWFLDRTSLVLTTGSIAFLIGVFFTGFFSKRFGKRNALIGLTLLNGITVLAFYLVPGDAFYTMLALNALGNLLAGPTPALVWAIYTDVVDYGEWKFGRRTPGLAFSAAMLAQKFGITIGSASAGWMLGWYGFVANTEQSSETLGGIRILFSLIPGILAIANGLVLFGYKLSDEKLAEIVAELEERRSNESS